MTRSDGTLRVFIALPIPPLVKSGLEQVVQHLADQVPRGIRWVGLDGIHLTLKFLGNIGPTQVEDITGAMQRASLTSSSFRLHMSGLGTFPNERRPRVIWAGVQGDLQSLGKLQAGIEGEVSGLGFPRENRPFTPHLTLGRVRDQSTSNARLGIGAAVSKYAMGSTEPWLVESVRLVQSNLGPGVITYSDLASVPLVDAASPQNCHSEERSDEESGAGFP